MGNKMMKAASLLLAASLLTGCSVTNTASGTPEASGGAVSGSVAAEEKGEELAGRSRNYLENSNNRYVIDYDEDKDVRLLVQYQLDGTKIKETRTDIYGLDWVTDEWIYCSMKDKEEDKLVLWRIPIRKTEKGDKLLTDKKEKVRKAASLDVDYVTDSYLILDIYGDSGKEGEGICKYDFETGRMTELIPGKEEAESLWGDEYPIMWEGDLFYEGEEKLYRLNPETGECSSLYTFKSGSKEFEYIEDYALAGGNLYLYIEKESYKEREEGEYSYKLYRYDCASGKIECMFSDKELVKAAEKLKLGKLQEVTIGELYSDQDRLLFDVDINFSKKEQKSEVHYYKNELFSVLLEGSEKFRREDKLMDYLDKKGEYEKIESNESAEYAEYMHHTSWIEGYIDGQILAHYRKGKDEDSRYVLYDLKTGEIKDMAEKELPKKYYELLGY